MIGSFSIWHILFAVVVIALLFGGRGRISGIMGDTAKGIKAFREGLKGEDEAHKEEEEPPKPLPKSSAKSESVGTRAKTKAKTSTSAKTRAKAKADS